MFSLLLLHAAAAADGAQTPAAGAVTPVVASTLVEPDPKTMSQREIKAFNATLPKNHPFYIRCTSSVEIGSLAKRIYSCRTNRQWELSDQAGNRNARDTVEAMQGKAVNSN